MASNHQTLFFKSSSSKSYIPTETFGWNRERNKSATVTASQLGFGNTKASNMIFDPRKTLKNRTTSITKHPSNVFNRTPNNPSAWASCSVFNDKQHTSACSVFNSNQHTNEASATFGRWLQQMGREEIGKAGCSGKRKKTGVLCVKC